MKKLIHSVINILFFIIGIILSVYNFMTINIAISFLTEFSLKENFLDIMIFFIYYIPFVLWLIILFIFYRNISKNKISKNYGYSYVIFLFLFILYYIFIFNNAKVEYIPKVDFQTIHHDKDFLSVDNAYNLVNDFNPQLSYDIQDFKIYCLTDESCSAEDKENTIRKSQDYIDNNFLTYLEFVDGLDKINQKSFIKSDYENNNFLRIRGIITSLKFQKIIDKKYLESNQFNLLLEYYDNMYKFSNMLLEGDGGVINFIVGYNIRFNILDNFDYLIKTDLLDKKQIILLSTLIETNKIKNTDVIYNNMIKSEDLQNFDIEARIYNSMIFNIEEFSNYRRYMLQKRFIESIDTNFSIRSHPFTQAGIYNFLYADIDYSTYKQDLIDIIKKEEEFVKNGKLRDY